MSLIYEAFASIKLMEGTTEDGTFALNWHLSTGHVSVLLSHQSIQITTEALPHPYLSGIQGLPEPAPSVLLFFTVESWFLCDVEIGEVHEPIYLEGPCSAIFISPNAFSLLSEITKLSEAFVPLPSSPA